MCMCDGAQDEQQLYTKDFTGSENSEMKLNDRSSVTTFVSPFEVLY